MADVRFPCPSCGAVLKVPNPEARQLRCYQCGKMCPVPATAADGVTAAPVPAAVSPVTSSPVQPAANRPTPTASSRAPAIERERPPAETSPPEDGPWWTRRGFIILLAVGACVIICAALAVAAVSVFGLIKQQLAVAEENALAPEDEPGADAGDAEGSGDAPAVGPPKGALHFARRSHVELARTQALLDLNGTFTIEMWVSWSPEAPQPLYLAGDEAWPGMSPNVKADRPSGWVLRTTAPVGGQRALDFTMAARREKEPDSWWLRAVGRPAPHNGEWQHVAVCKSPDEVRLYWNGELHARQSCKGLRFVASPSNIFLGVRRFAHADRWFDGEVREFRISSAVLYPRDFAPETVFHFGEDKRDLVRLDFQHPGNGMIPDASGHDHNGRLEDAEWMNWPAASPGP